MSKEALLLRREADTAIHLFKVGEGSYDDAVNVTKKYIDHCNVIAKRIAKEYDMKPRLMSVKGYMR